MEYEYDNFSFKITNVYIGPDNESDESLPQTGTSAHMIPIFANIGIGLILFGLIINKKKKKKIKTIKNLI